MCPDTTICMSSYAPGACVLILLHVCPHTRLCIYVSWHHYMCPRTTTHVSSYCYLCVYTNICVSLLGPIELPAHTEKQACKVANLLYLLLQQRAQCEQRGADSAEDSKKLLFDLNVSRNSQAKIKELLVCTNIYIYIYIYIYINIYIYIHI